MNYRFDSYDALAEVPPAEQLRRAMERKARYAPTPQTEAELVREEAAQERMREANRTAMAGLRQAVEDTKPKPRPVPPVDLAAVADVMAGETEWRRGIRRIAEAHGITVADLKGECRARHMVAARRSAAAYLRSRGWTTPQIGKCLGGRDHTTILHLLRRAA